MIRSDEPDRPEAASELAGLLARGAEEGCLRLSEVERLAEELDLGEDEAEAEAVYEEIDRRAIAHDQAEVRVDHPLKGGTCP